MPDGQVRDVDEKVGVESRPRDRRAAEVSS